MFKRPLTRRNEAMIGEAPFENGKVESVRALLNARTKFAILLLDYSLTKNRIIKISGMEKRTGQRKRRG